MSTDELFDDWLRGETGRPTEAPEPAPVTDPSFGAGVGIVMLGHRPAAGEDVFREALADAADRARGGASMWP